MTLACRATGHRIVALGLRLMLLGVLSASVVSHARTSSTPAIAGTPSPSVAAGQHYEFTPTVTVPDGQWYSLSIYNLPAWASFDSATGSLYGTPTASDSGTYSDIRIVLAAGQTVVSLPVFSIKVGANGTPVISGTPKTLAPTGSTYSFRPKASDPDGEALTFSIANKPAWASFATTNGRLYGKPDSTEVGTYSNIVISVSDGLHSVALPPFSIKVAPNRPPAIEGAPPATAKAGKSYSFSPTASDPDGQRLRFSIVNKPAWARFASRTGRLYGTPDSTAVGTYSGIRISVSDGQSTDELPEFAITVATVTSGSATVSWTPPATYEDGTPIANLAGYRVFYGPSPSELSKSVDIPNPTITSALIEALAPGTWYFAVRAYTTARVESDLSRVAYKRLD